MKEELELAIIEKNPEIFLFQNFRGKGHFGFECSDGWYNILDVMFDHITRYVKDNNDTLERYLNAQDMIENGRFDEVPHYLADHLRQLDEGIGRWPEHIDFPVAQQIKEKFGTLNVYLNSYHDAIHEIVQMAEGMSAHTCEKCGNIGSLRGGGWIKTLCDEHEVERQKAKADREAQYRSFEASMVDRK